METRLRESGNQAPRLGLDFWKYFVGQSLSNLGSAFTEFAVPLIVFKLTRSAMNLGIATAVTFVPYLLFGLVIGAWVDRLDRKRLMIICDVLQAVVIVTVPVAAYLDLLSIWWIYGVGFLSSTIAIFFTSAQFAAIPKLVNTDNLVSANGRLQASQASSFVAGPLLAGVLVALVDVTTLMLFDSLTFLISALSLMLVRTRFNVEVEVKQKTTLRVDIVEGLTYVWKHPVLRNISIMMAVTNFFDASPGAQLVLFAKQRLSASDSKVALLYAAGSAGIVGLSLLAGPLRRKWSFSAVALTSLAIHGMAVIGLAFTRSYWVALILWAAASGLGILFNVNTGSLRQTIVPNHMLGRIISIAGVLAWSAIPLGSLAGGFLIERFGVVPVFAVIGTVVTLIPILFSFGPLGRADGYIQSASGREAAPVDADLP